MALLSLKVTSAASVTGTQIGSSQVQSARVTGPSTIGLVLNTAGGPQGPAGVGALWRGLWGAGTTYAIGDGVTASDGHNYIGLTAGNLNHNPVGDGGVHWSDLISSSVIAISPTVNTGQILMGAGSAQQLFAATVGQLFEMKVGTNATPDSTLNPALKVTRTTQYAAGAFTGAGPELCASIYGLGAGVGTDAHQPIGVLGVALQSGTGGGDALGIQGLGRQLSGSTGNAIGGYFNGRTESGSAGTANAIQLNVENLLAEDLGVTNGVCNTVLNWMRPTGVQYHHATGPFNVGAMEQLGGGPGTGPNVLNCTLVAGSNVINTPNAAAGDQFHNICGPGNNLGVLPPGVYVSLVTAGVSYTLANDYGSANALVSGTFTLQVGGGPTTNYGWLTNSTAPVITATFADYGNALTSILIQGAHANAAIQVGAGAGLIAVGSNNVLANTALLQVQTPDTTNDYDPLIYVGNAAGAHAYSIRLRSSAGNNVVGVAKANQLVSGVTAGDLLLGTTTTSTWTRMVGSAASTPTLSVKNDGTFSAFGATGAAVNATAFTNTAAQAASFDLPAAYTLAQLGAVVVQLIKQLGSNSGYGLVKATTNF